MEEAAGGDGTGEVREDGVRGGTACPASSTEMIFTQSAKDYVHEEKTRGLELRLFAAETRVEELQRTAMDRETENKSQKDMIRQLRHGIQNGSKAQSSALSMEIGRLEDMELERSQAHGMLEDIQWKLTAKQSELDGAHMQLRNVSEEAADRLATKQRETDRLKRELDEARAQSSTLKQRIMLIASKTKTPTATPSKDRDLPRLSELDLGVSENEERSFTQEADSLALQGKVQNLTAANEALKQKILDIETVHQKMLGVTKRMHQSQVDSIRQEHSEELAEEARRRMDLAQEHTSSLMMMEQDGLGAMQANTHERSSRFEIENDAKSLRTAQMAAQDKALTLNRELEAVRNVNDRLRKNVATVRDEMTNKELMWAEEKEDLLKEVKEAQVQVAKVSQMEEKISEQHAAIQVTGELSLPRCTTCGTRRGGKIWLWGGGVRGKPQFMEQELQKAELCESEAQAALDRNKKRFEVNGVPLNKQLRKLPLLK
eukprot:gene12645-14949_t